MRIGIDIDGVLTDVEKFQIEYGSKYFYEKYKKRIVKYNSYEIYNMFDVSLEKDDEFWNECIWDYLKFPSRNFASEVIQKLKDEKNEIYIITARSNDVSYIDNMTKEDMQLIVKNWLKENKIYYDKLIFSGEEKLDVCLENKIDLMIEDKPQNIMEISTKIPVIAFHASYNENNIGKNIYTCYSWPDIYSQIEEKFHE